MIVRSFRLSDYSEVTALLNEALTTSCCKETMAAFAKQLNLDSELVLVGVVENKVAGSSSERSKRQQRILLPRSGRRDHRRKGSAKR